MGVVVESKEQAELLEIVTYGFAAHQRAHHIEEVGVRNVPHPRGHPPAEGGVHEFNKLFVERKVIQKLGKKSPKCGLMLVNILDLFGFKKESTLPKDVFCGGFPNYYQFDH